MLRRRDAPAAPLMIAALASAGDYPYVARTDGKISGCVAFNHPVQRWLLQNLFVVRTIGLKSLGTCVFAASSPASASARLSKEAVKPERSTVPGNTRFGRTLRGR